MTNQNNSDPEEKMQKVVRNATPELIRAAIIGDTGKGISLYDFQKKVIQQYKEEKRKKSEANSQKKPYTPRPILPREYLNYFTNYAKEENEEIIKVYKNFTSKVMSGLNPLLAKGGGKQTRKTRKATRRRRMTRRR
jgi:hypothetical protein